MAFSRTLGNEKTIVVFNYGSIAGTIDVTGIVGGSVLHRLWPTGGSDLSADGTGLVKVDQAAQSFSVFGLGS
jgi:hypothetical protein